ncbi:MULTISPECIES: GNAT family N-acetyltransferase [unclassified Streptomyces]|uniref:GNAT family N-acetyltransferase n=1 Tax=unclassified Streptomyces TaxID=2593676 RepID=UPI0022583AC1|nr:MULTISPECIES: GNAT family N-acetyltransferase [unclassified Streptomyces]MCX4524903.1 GNAT family N-acetyltransferase [Streptomyces sp. NBC_01551]MCX4544585.1 GNAT family N-acetyltransferase [Streptomyces sp. NBC_01565]
MGMSVTISAAAAEDAEQIFKLQYLAFQREAELYGNYRIQPLTQTLDSLKGELETDTVLVARLGDEVVGTVRGNVDEDGTAKIAKLCVHPRLQGHGLGARLLRAVEVALQGDGGTTRFRLHTGHKSESNLRLYRKAGYTQVGGRTASDGVKLVILEKEAKSADDFAVSA